MINRKGTSIMAILILFLILAVACTPPKVKSKNVEEISKIEVSFEY